jgi:hypothetical protein
MDLNDVATWPAPVLDYLERHCDLFEAWEKREGDSSVLTAYKIPLAREIALAYDHALLELRTLLNPHTAHGYHCTRLTESEIDHIASDGMQLPNGNTLKARIQAVQDAGLIELHVAERLRGENQAGERNRAEKIWFCFFAPHIAGQSGIERFFRSWGGEALYNSHERDSDTGPSLTTIGIPCLIEADVPLATSRLGFFETKLARQFLITRHGFDTIEPVHHEGYAERPIPAANIRRIIRRHNPDFVALTKCDSWIPPLPA